MLHRIEQSPFAHGEARQDTGAPHDGEPQNVDFGFLGEEPDFSVPDADRDRLSRCDLARSSPRSEPAKYISFISIGSINGIDFIRRIGECYTCWVVGDIGAALELKAIEEVFARHRHLRVV